jgi:hypothetical protein
MPFGLTNAPASFQSAMNNIFHPYLNDFVVVFLDDILIFSKDPTQHAKHLQTVLEILRQNHYFACLHKCSFAELAIEFLGHIISRNTLSMDPAQIQAINDWPTPTTIKHVRSFLGLAGYYWRFIDHFATIAPSLTNLTRHDIHDINTHWNDDCTWRSTPSKQRLCLHHVWPSLTYPFHSKSILILPTLPWAPSFFNARHLPRNFTQFASFHANTHTLSLAIQFGNKNFMPSSKPCASGVATLKALNPPSTPTTKACPPS